MKKKLKLSLHYSLLLLPLTTGPLLCMENNNESDKHNLEKSIIVAEETTGGLGWFRTPSDTLWGVGPNIYSDIQNKTYKPFHTGYKRKLDAGFEYFLVRDEEKNILDLCQICVQNYPQAIQIGDSQARLAHKYLETSNNNKKLDLAFILKVNDEKFIQEINDNLADIKATFNRLKEEINKRHKDYIEQRNNLIKEKAREIRNVKKALIQIHQLNETFKLPQDGYCSDKEKNSNPTEKAALKKLYNDNKKIENDDKKIENNDYYSDEYILKTIGIHYAIDQTKVKSENLFKAIDDLNNSIQTILTLKIDHFDNK